MGKKQKMGRIPRGAMKQQSMPRMPQMSQEELQMLAAQQQAMQVMRSGFASRGGAGHAIVARRAVEQTVAAFTYSRPLPLH
mmetsp:Transcript_9034/g.26288  ORF Transcript_9034/g.26288 Transcript_9034/m.26288 type:complete len:81 (-) Transcript_9034:577-819(-)